MAKSMSKGSKDLGKMSKLRSLNRRPKSMRETIRFTVIPHLSEVVDPIARRKRLDTVQRVRTSIHRQRRGLTAPEIRRAGKAGRIHDKFARRTIPRNWMSGRPNPDHPANR